MPTSAALARHSVPATQRHLAPHDGHLAVRNDVDKPSVTGEVLVQGGLAGDRAAWTDRLAQLGKAGATEVAYQPAGPDGPRELEALASVSG